MRHGMPPAEYTYPKLVLCFLELEKGSAVLMLDSLAEGLPVKSPPFLGFSFTYSSGTFFLAAALPKLFIKFKLSIEFFSFKYLQCAYVVLIFRLLWLFE